MPAAKTDPRVDAYIAKAQPFAQPILAHFRSLVHKGCPGVEEALKWSMPFFVYKGVNFAQMAGFKQHCTLGFWGKEIAAALRETGVAEGGGMARLGRITHINELPSDKELLGYMRQAREFIDSGNYTSPMAGRTAKAKLTVPEPTSEFAAALRENKQAGAAFKAFPPGCRREYIEWIAEAKRPETRDKRIATAVEWIAEGKRRNWKYESA